MAITNAEVISFVNAYERPRCEDIRAILVKLQQNIAKWDSGISALTPNDAGEMLEDGRETEGVSRLNGAHIHLIMARVTALAEILETPGAMDVINLGCVRPLNAS